MSILSTRLRKVLELLNGPERMGRNKASDWRDWGRRLVKRVKPRASCSSFNMFIRVAMCFRF